MLNKIVRLLAVVILVNAIQPTPSAQAAEPVYCGQENGSCTATSGELRDAYYCGAGKCNHTVVNGTFSCNNATFGDPSYGYVKSCYLGDANYTYRYPEWENPTSTPVITELEPVIIAFGTLQTTNWTARALGTGNCDRSTFDDPAYGYVKSCYAGPKFNYCVNENGTCYVNGGVYGITLVAYGPYGGPFNYKVAVTSIACNNATFGDPAPNYAKMCFMKPM